MSYPAVMDQLLGDITNAAVSQIIQDAKDNGIPAINHVKSARWFRRNFIRLADSWKPVTAREYAMVSQMAVLQTKHTVFLCHLVKTERVTLVGMGEAS